MTHFAEMDFDVVDVEVLRPYDRWEIIGNTYGTNYRIKDGDCGIFDWYLHQFDGNMVGMLHKSIIEDMEKSLDDRTYWPTPDPYRFLKLFVKSKEHGWKTPAEMSPAKVVTRLLAGVKFPERPAYRIPGYNLGGYKDMLFVKRPVLWTTKHKMMFMDIIFDILSGWKGFGDFRDYLTKIPVSRDSILSYLIFFMKIRKRIVVTAPKSIIIATNRFLPTVEPKPRKVLPKKNELIDPIAEHCTGHTAVIERSNGEVVHRKVCLSSEEITHIDDIYGFLGLETRIDAESLLEHWDFGRDSEVDSDDIEVDYQGYTLEIHDGNVSCYKS